MPRKAMGSGGPRVATPGKSYSNRTDLNKPMPVTTAPGQAYGAAGTQAAAQHVVPMAAGAPNPVAQAQDQAQVAQPSPLPMQPPVQPGSLPLLHAPSDRPGEPVTNGAVGGAGAGPEALQSGLPLQSTTAMLQALAQHTNNPAIAYLAQRSQSLGQ